MAKNDNLSDFMTDIADAIRAKKGTSEPINAQDFSAEIASIETGGGGAMEYWSVQSQDIITGLGQNAEVLVYATLGKVILQGTTMAVPMGMALEMGDILAFAWSNNLRVIMNNNIMTLGEILTSFGLDFEDAGFDRITEEEFYSIN